MQSNDQQKIDVVSDQNLDNVLITSLAIIDTPGGDVLHGMKVDALGYAGFGEAYFSSVEQGFIKGWKRHREMTLNLIVIDGEIEFVIFDERPSSSTYQKFQKVTLSLSNFARLTIPPMLWVAFRGSSQRRNLLLNVANLVHDPQEMDTKPISDIYYSW